MLTTFPNYFQKVTFIEFVVQFLFFFVVVYCQFASETLIFFIQIDRQISVFKHFHWSCKHGGQILLRVNMTSQQVLQRKQLQKLRPPTITPPPYELTNKFSRNLKIDSFGIFFPALKLPLVSCCDKYVREGGTGGF